MKTIGLLTYHWVSNFGAQLQTLSTVGYLHKHGYNTVVINWVPDRLNLLYKKITSEEQLKAHQAFQQYYGAVSPICHNDEDICKVIEDFNIDLIIIGSDSVLTYRPYIDRYAIYKWGIKFVKPFEDNEFPNPFWGSFLYKITVPTVMMSVAAQNTFYPHIIFRKKSFYELLSKIKLITVRDIWTQKTIQYLSNKTINPVITPDPVFAFNQNLDEQLYINKEQIQSKYGLPDSYVVVSSSQNYFGDLWLSSLIDLFHSSGLTVISLPKAEKTCYTPIADINLHLPINPLEWYYIIKYSSGYIGELMHALLVSLHNSIPVFSIDNYGFIKNGVIDSSSSKISQILEYYNLTNNTFNVKQRNVERPSAEYVFNSISTFDKEKCREKSNRRLEDYNTMMSNILAIM